MVAAYSFIEAGVPQLILYDLIPRDLTIPAQFPPKFNTHFVEESLLLSAHQHVSQ